MSHYKFAAPQRGGNAQLKLVCYFGKQSFTRYSFDGRMNRAGTAPKTYDKANNWNADNGLQYLLDLFDKEHRNNPAMTYAFIADSNYPASGDIKQVWSVTNNDWTTQVLDNASRFQHIKAKKVQPDCYTFRLSVPLKSEKDTQKWVNFFTTENQIGSALLNLIGQFNTWQTLNPDKVQPIGQIYGSAQSLYDVAEREVPRFAWFDTPNLLPKYHRTQRVIQGYQQMISANQNFEEFISNL